MVLVLQPLLVVSERRQQGVDLLRRLAVGGPVRLVSLVQAIARLRQFIAGHIVDEIGLDLRLERRARVEDLQQEIALLADQQLNVGEHFLHVGDLLLEVVSQQLLGVGLRLDGVRLVVGMGGARPAYGRRARVAPQRVRHRVRRARVLLLLVARGRDGRVRLALVLVGGEGAEPLCEREHGRIRGQLVGPQVGHVGALPAVQAVQLVPLEEHRVDALQAEVVLAREHLRQLVGVVEGQFAQGAQREVLDVGEGRRRVRHLVTRGAAPAPAPARAPPASRRHGAGPRRLAARLFASPPLPSWRRVTDARRQPSCDVTAFLPPARAT